MGLRRNFTFKKFTLYFTVIMYKTNLHHISFYFNLIFGKQQNKLKINYQPFQASDNTSARWRI